jgi:hypothetical protein
LTLGAVTQSVPLLFDHRVPLRRDRLRSLARVGVRVAAGGLAVVLAYGTTARLLVGASPAGAWRAPVLAVGVALVVALLLPRGGRGAPDIHDRQTDYLVGLPLLACACFALTVMPRTVSDQYWSLRIDVLSLPLFVAGAIAVLFGVRALWRLRAPVVVLFAGTPALYAGLPASAITVVAAVAFAAGLVALWRWCATGPVGVARRVAPPQRDPVRRIGPGMVVVLLAGAACALGASALDPAKGRATTVPMAGERHP